jgi:hypothetical protein
VNVVGNALALAQGLNAGDRLLNIFRPKNTNIKPWLD